MITAVTPVSPIKSHPDISVLTETIDSVRHHLPDADVVLMFDGVRAEQENRRADYEEATHRTLEKAWGRPFVFDQHLHQVGMLRKVIDTIDTPLMLFMEQDAPLTKDPIDWEACRNLILSGEADIVRFSHESTVLDAHKHLMRERHGEFLRTVQFSARPHLASVAYYRRVLKDHFSTEACTFTEDVLHGACQAWPDDHKLFLYHPEGSIQRSYHLDGRAGEPKFDDSLVF